MKTLASVFPFARIAKAIFALLLLCMVFSLPSCNNGTDATKDLDDFKTYVQQHKDSVDKYTGQSIVALDSQYNDKKAKLEKDYDKLNDSMKVAFDKTKQDWNAFKDTVAKKVTLKTSANAAPIAKTKVIVPDTLAASLAMKGVKPDFSNLTGPKVLPEYHFFVDVVNHHKDTYTEDDWNAVNSQWHDLNARSKEVETAITEDNKKKIRKLRLEYTGIKALNRPTNRAYEGDDQPVL